MVEQPINYDVKRLSKDYIQNPWKKGEDIPIQDILYLYIELNLMYKEVSIILGCTTGIVSNYCKLYGITKSK